MKEQKGITIVAMIITIIVMVILAGVAITTAVLDGGILQKTQNAQTEYEIAEELEKVKLSASEAYLAGSGIIIEENLEKALDSNIGVRKYSLDSSNNEYFETTITETERKYKIYPNGKVEGPIDDTLGVATVGIKVEKNSTIDGEKYSSVNPIIPAGFTAVNLGGDWNAEGGPEVDKGLVIMDDSGNEFVWVPVNEEIDVNGYGLNSTDKREPDVVTRQASNYNSYDAISANLQRAGCEDKDNNGTLNVDDFKTQLQEEYKEMTESVNKYKGFYVGRYETSRNGSNPQSKRSRSASGSGEIIESAYNSTIENDWYGLYALNKNYTTNSVQGSMMWGIQFDKMLSWMDVGENTTIDDKNNKDRTCGTAQKDVIKNVYDLYGNSHEWTIEKTEGSYGGATYHCRTLRGGSYFTSSAYSKPFMRYSYAPTSNIAGMPTALGGYNASRISLYIK